MFKLRKENFSKGDKYNEKEFLNWLKGKINGFQRVVNK
jgi:hypothetical protein